jgi:class 3 adenylate cyclase/tetratricopeptide (TPR) repeat protein
VRACPKCGQENPEIARFCLACGTALTDAAPPREVRKTVTVVFTDVTGSTSLGERLDPESLRRVMSRYFDEMRRTVERHGGTVEKFIGDAVMAVFGVPTLHEDDALRAVRAAWEMRESLALLNKELELDWGVTIAIRTGANTGPVVTGSAEGDQRLVSGDAVNVAARLEQAAEPGDILIGEETHRLVRDAVQAEPVEPLTLKGKASPVPAYRLLDVTPGAPGVARRLDSPLVGRDGELRLLGEALARSRRERACLLFTILGSAGVGKSRLVEEFLSTGASEATVLRGRCLSYGEGITFWPVSEVLIDAAGLDEIDSPDEVRGKLLGVLEDDPDAELVAERLSHLLGLTDVGAVREETFWAVRRALEAMARRDPVVVVFDDIHWGEPTFLDLVEHIADWARDAPIFLLCIARPELLDDRPGWAGGKLNATSILLEPLTEQESEQLIDNLLGRAGLAKQARVRIAEAAEGNPLFVEQMLGVLIDDGLLRRDDGRWVPMRDLSSVAIPPTIQALLAARLERLSEEERSVIERASVEGKVFHRGAVSELSPDPIRPRVGAHLMTLLRRELIRPDRATFAGEDAFRFRHLLIRDAAYEALPKRDRADLHRRFAAWLERVAGDRPAEYEEIVAYHLERGYRYREELGPVGEEDLVVARRAADLLVEAGHRAAARGDVPAAATLLERAHRLLPPGDPVRLELIPDLSASMSDLGRLSDVKTYLEEVLQEATAAGDPRLEMYALLAQMELRLGTNEGYSTREGAVLARRAIRLFEELGDDQGLALAWGALADSHWIEARWASMREPVERARVHARRAGDRMRTSSYQNWHLAVDFWGTTPVPEGIRRCEEALEKAETRYQRAQILRNLGSFVAMQGRFDEARSMEEEARAILDDLGSIVWAKNVAFQTGPLEMLAGDPAAAERELRETFDFLREIGEKGWLSSIAAFMGEAVYQQGRYEEAERYLLVSKNAANPDDGSAQWGWRTVMGKVLARRGELEEGERIAREAVAIIERTDEIDHQGQGWFDLAEVLELAGKGDEARTALEEAVARFERKGNVVMAERVRRRLDEMQPGPPVARPPR